MPKISRLQHRLSLLFDKVNSDNQTRAENQEASLTSPTLEHKGLWEAQRREHCRVRAHKDARDLCVNICVHRILCRLWDAHFLCLCSTFYVQI